MSRIRYIKPGFFGDEDLGECSLAARLLFAGLWTIADREGRLEDRPKRIKARLFPYDDLSADTLLDELTIQREDRPPLIVRYVVSGVRYICIPGWHNHQKPHFREKPSTIPEPDEHNLGSAQARAVPCSAALVTGNGERGTGNGVRDFPDSGESCADFHGDFERWWVHYGRIGSKADAETCYLHWRKHGAEDGDLTLAATRYLAHCRQTQTSIKHAATFLAKKPNRWREWLDEEHGDGNAVATNGPQVVKRDICPLCEADITIDEGGEHCPVCAWRR